MSLRIYGYAGSINVRKVLWTCAELELPFEREDWAGPFRSTSEPAFLALNPVGLVPVINDGGALVWESNTIIRYLARSRGREDLLPAAPIPCAQIEMWMDWQASDFNNSWRVAFQGLIRRNPDHQDPVAIRRSLETWSRMVAVIDAQLGRSGEYLCGKNFTLADIAIGLSIHRWRSFPNRPALVNVDRYYELLCERPGFRSYGRDGGP
ncbi:glutathione S-transferase [Boseaceae bacterium BT-24-1]|nr:glutathione S-transferase [Boseaceae bacterium BT-24-1]